MPNYKLILYSDKDYNFVYNLKKDAYKKYVEENYGKWDENEQKDYFKNFIKKYENNIYIIFAENKQIGFYQDDFLADGSYEIGNICIISEFRGKGIGTNILESKIAKNSDKDIHIQYFKQNRVGNLYKKLGFVENGETEFHYKMVKSKNIS